LKRAGNVAPKKGLWDSFWAAHATRDNLFHILLWRIRFLFTSKYAQHIAAYTSKLTAAKLIEVGCGSARTLHYLEKHYDSSLCFALDLSPQAIMVATRLSPEFKAAIASAFSLPVKENEVDVSFSIGLIEHFTREQAAEMTREKIRVTRPGGTVGIVVPWQSSIYNLIVRRAFGKYWPFGDEDPFHRRELIEFMEALGLKDVKLHVIYGSSILGIGRKAN
jgi:SAM-dependent methyltransferase